VAVHELLDRRPAGVVRAGPRPDPFDDGRRGARSELQLVGPEGHQGDAPQRPLPRCDGGGDHLGHPGVALQPRHLGPIGSPGHVVGELVDGGHPAPRFAEGREDALDVAQEDRVGTDEEHARLLEREPVRVEQERRPVQGHRRLPGAGAALDDHEPVERCPDDAVLFGLDRRDDVAHPAGADPAERFEQRRFADQDEVVLTGLVGLGGVLAERFVVEAQDPPPLGEEVPAAAEPERLGLGGPVERLGDRCPPIDDEGLLVLVGDRHPAEVVARPALDVDAAEAEVQRAEPEAGPPPQAGPLADVTLEETGEGRRVLGPFGFRQLERLAFELLQAVVGPIDVRLFGGQLRMHGGMPSGAFPSIARENSR
jgi:hypothetical protein